MKINTKVVSFAKGFAEGFVNSGKDPMTHISAGIVAANSLINKDDKLDDTFSKVAGTYLWSGILDGFAEGINSLSSDK